MDIPLYISRMFEAYISVPHELPPAASRIGLIATPFDTTQF